MLKKADEELKKKAEEAEVARALKEFESTFQNTSKIDRAWVKGGIVNPGGGGVKTEEPPSSSIYKPTTKLGDRLKTLEVGKVESKLEAVKKPVIGRKIGQGKKMTNLELFKEELKSIQQQREQRHQLRQMNRARGMSDSKFPACTSISEFSLEVEETDRRNRFRDYSAGGYPYDEDSDKSSTNLFLGNLNPKMTEQQLCDIFGRYGPLASVKIMWPRTEEQRSVARNCGFVAFMNRVDAERALDNLRGKELMGYEMKLGWGKTVHVPPYPVYVPPALLEIIKPPSQSGLPFNAQPREWLKPLLPLAKERARFVTESLGSGEPAAHRIPPTPERFPFNIHTMKKEKFKEVLEEAVVKVVVPTDRTVLATIHRLIEFVVREGPQFEAAIMHREEKNPHYKFLFDYQTSEHLYYRWKLWSILHGEAVNKWSQEEFRMYEGGPLWRPPPIDFFSNGMPEELVEPADYPVAPGYTGKDDEALDADAREEAFRRGLNSGSSLTDAQRGRLAVWINDLEPSRAQVGDVMFWCLEHADAAADVVDVITKSLKSSSKFDSTPTLDTDGDFSIKPPSTVQAIAARLFLTSDILYNSGAKVPNASFYRKCFESRLREMFVDIGGFYRELEGKLKAEQLKQKVMLCFRAWEEWAIYPNEFLIQLQNIFLGLTTPSNAKESKANATVDEEEIAGVPLEPPAVTSGSSGAVVGTSNVESLDGAPLVQYDGDPLDVDGSPLNTEDDKGAPKDEDFEGVPLDPSPQTQSEADKPTAAAPLFVPSKWESIDPEKAVEEAVTSNRWDLFADPTASLDSDTSADGVTLKDNNEDVDGRPLDGFGVVGIGLVAYDDDDAVSLSPPSAQPPSEPISDARRQALREIEMKVMKYQDELEACRKRGDSSVTDDAIAKQVNRFRERLLEKLEETIQETSTKSPSSRSAKSTTKSSKPSSGSKRHHTSGSSSIKRHEESRSSHRRRSKSLDDRRSSPSNSKRPRTDASESRHRDRSPRRSRRSRSPSQSKRRSSNASNTRSLKRR